MMTTQHNFDNHARAYNRLSLGFILCASVALALASLMLPVAHQAPQEMALARLIWLPLKLIGAALSLGGMALAWARL